MAKIIGIDLGTSNSAENSVVSGLYSPANTQIQACFHTG
jgi:molecular chaperone DnaK (HSP70)